MKLSKAKAQDVFKDNPQALSRINKIKDDFVFIDIMGKEAYKTARQNRLYFALLSCFWASGCSSFVDYDEMRLYYKRMAGLVKYDGKVLKEQSWAEATKEQAKYTIDNLLRDMDFSGVMGSSQCKKYEIILKGIGEWLEDLN